MREIDVTADALVQALLRLSENEAVCLLDSCGVGHLGSHLLIAGVRPIESVELSNQKPEKLLQLLDEKLSGDDACIFTLSYDFGVKLQDMSAGTGASEPDVFLASFETLIIHDYDSGKTFVVGDPSRYGAVVGPLTATAQPGSAEPRSPRVESNFSRAEYVAAVERIREYIRSGDTYQTNLTQQLTCTLDQAISPQRVFDHLRQTHPAPFAAFIRREHSTVVSASPERFFSIDRSGVVRSSPIKGTRRRGTTPDEDARLRAELRTSEKDRAENTMIVDLVRNDLGRVCEFGSVVVEKLCDIEEHPTLFHLVSTVRGDLRPNTRFSEILRAVFPCGSITGAPKIRTMQLIEEIETVRRGLSMGAIGVYIPPDWDLPKNSGDAVYDLSVAIRTMVIRDNIATFTVGGGIVIDSVAEKEFDESMLKAKALLTALGTETGTS